MDELNLESISPIAFSLTKVGDVVLIKIKKPRMNEFRSKIGPAVTSSLVFKNETKIGMLPLSYTSQISPLVLNGKKAKITYLNENNREIKIIFRVTSG